MGGLAKRGGKVVGAVTKPISRGITGVAKPIVGKKTAKKIGGLTNTAIGGGLGFLVGGPIGAGVGAQAGNYIDKSVNKKPKVSAAATANSLTPDVPPPVLPVATEELATSPTVPSMDTSDVLGTVEDTLDEIRRRAKRTRAGEISEAIFGSMSSLPRIFE